MNFELLHRQPASAYTAELVSNDEFEGIVVIHGDTAIVAFGEYEEATNRWEFRTDHRDRKEVPFLSLYAGNVVASSEFARRVAEAVCAVFDEIG